MRTESGSERATALDALPAYLFRGDANYSGGAMGLPLNEEEAQAADIRNPADHVLRKERETTSVYVSFTSRMSVAKRFGQPRLVIKVEVAALRQLEVDGTIKLLLPEDVYLLLRSAGRRFSKEAGPTRDYMIRNAEVLIEGQIPARVIQRAKEKSR